MYIYVSRYCRARSMYSRSDRVVGVGGEAASTAMMQVAWHHDAAGPTTH